MYTHGISCFCVLLHGITPVNFFYLWIANLNIAIIIIQFSGFWRKCKSSNCMYIVLIIFREAVWSVLYSVSLDGTILTRRQYPGPSPGQLAQALDSSQLYASRHRILRPYNMAFSIILSIPVHVNDQQAVSEYLAHTWRLHLAESPNTIHGT